MHFARSPFVMLMQWCLHSNRGRGELNSIFVTGTNNSMKKRLCNIVAFLLKWCFKNLDVAFFFGLSALIGFFRSKKTTSTLNNYLQYPPSNVIFVRLATPQLDGVNICSSLTKQSTYGIKYVLLSNEKKARTGGKTAEHRQEGSLCPVCHTCCNFTLGRRPERESHLTE